MKIKNLLLFAAVAMSVSASAQTDGELFFKDSGEPQTSGKPTKDHVFIRGNYDDMGEAKNYDNVISFKGGNQQLVWFYLNDDEIYQNQDIQNLTPIAYNKSGDLYNEITYNSLQCDLYVPQNIEIVSVEDEDGNESEFVAGDRMPNTASTVFQKMDNTVNVGEVVYNIYKVIIYNTDAYGSHFSAKNASKYKNGALKKDDAPLFGVYMQNNEAGHTADLIVANQIFGVRELDIAWSAAPDEDPQKANNTTICYGTGGDLQSQLFMLYNRARVYGSTSVVETIGEKEINNVKYYNVAGMESNVPFDGVNIKVVTYNDGTTSTSKVMK